MHIRIMIPPGIVEFWGLILLLRFAAAAVAPPAPASLIPRHLYISYKTLPTAAELSDMDPSLIRMREREKAAGWTLHFIDNSMQDAFMERHFANTTYLWAYKQISPRVGVCNSDMWRLALLYVNGGVYLDSDGYLKTPLDEIIVRNSGGPGGPVTLMLPKERNVQEECYRDTHALSKKHLESSNPSLYAIINAVYSNAVISNWAIFAAPGHPILLKAMKNVVALIKAEYHSHSALDLNSRGAGENLWNRGRMVFCITGPMLLTRTIYQYQIHHNVSFDLFSPNISVVNADFKIYGGNPSVFNPGGGNQQYYKHMLQNPRTLLLKAYAASVDSSSESNSSIYSIIYKERCYGRSEQNSAPAPAPATDTTLLPNLLPMTHSMEDLKPFLTMLEAGTPFAFCPFNDGEIQAMDCTDPQRSVDFGWQSCSPALQTALRNAMLKPAKNTYIGIPCVCEHGSRPYARAIELLKISHAVSDSANACQDNAHILHNDPQFAVSLERITVANILVNSNYWSAQSEMARILNLRVQRSDRPIFVFMGNKSDPGELPFPNVHTLLPSTNAFDSHYQTMRTTAYLAKKGVVLGDVVLLMVGPLGRVLASEWAHLHPNTTFLSVGSFYDQFTWGRLDRNIGKKRACMSKQDVRARIQ